MRKFIVENNWYRKYRIPFPLVDIYFFKWKPNIQTKIHNHSGSGCIMILLKGKLQETIYNNSLETVQKKIYDRLLNVSYIHDNIGYHDIKNKCSESSCSVHIYHPKNHKTKYYN